MFYSFSQSFFKKLRNGSLPSEIDQKKFLRDEANLFEADPNGDTALLLAIKYGFQDFAVALINAGTGLNVTGSDGKPPLMFALEQSCEKAPEPLGGYKETALNSAIEYQQLAAIDYLFRCSRSRSYRLLYCAHQRRVPRR